MNFLNIQYFIAIAEEQSISSAARKLYVSQQSLSEHLKKLEDELGVPLIKRDKPMTLTVAGECLYDSGKVLLSDYDQMLSDIKNVTTSRQSSISVGIATYGEPPFLPELLERFMNKYPQYNVKVVKRQHADIIHNFRGVDLYISYLPVDHQLEVVNIMNSDPYCAVFQKDLAIQKYGQTWPLIEKRLKDEKNLSLISELPFIALYDRQGNLSLDLSMIFDEYHIHPTYSFISENIDLNGDMCLRGLGCFLAPRDYIYRRFAETDNSITDNLLSYTINVNSFNPCLAVCYEKGKHLHTSEICFISELRTLFSEHHKV